MRRGVRRLQHGELARGFEGWLLWGGSHQRSMELQRRAFACAFCGDVLRGWLSWRLVVARSSLSLAVIDKRLPSAFTLWVNHYSIRTIYSASLLQHHLCCCSRAFDTWKFFLDCLQSSTSAQTSVLRLRQQLLALRSFRLWAAAARNSLVAKCGLTTWRLRAMLLAFFCLDGAAEQRAHTQLTLDRLGEMARRLILRRSFSRISVSCQMTSRVASASRALLHIPEGRVLRQWREVVQAHAA
eukprot:5925523-Prymnesium_polylepis.1